MSEMTREEHLDWAKKRALEYLNRGELPNAIASMMSDMDKHPETKRAMETMSAVGVFCVINHDYAMARSWIEGFR